MFTWISKACGLALICLLAACQMQAGGGATSGQTRSLSVLSGNVRVAAPSGYCVDRQSARQQADGAVVLMGRCTGGSSYVPAVISATIGAAGSANALADGGVALAAFFQTNAGRAALSRTGQAGPVQVVQAVNAEGAFTLRIVEDGVGDYWRAIFGIAGRLVTLSVQAPAGSVLDPTAGRKVLAASISAMRRANPSP